MLKGLTTIDNVAALRYKMGKTMQRQNPKKINIGKNQQSRETSLNFIEFDMIIKTE